jgi:hypothetical protein
MDNLNPSAIQTEQEVHTDHSDHATNFVQSFDVYQNSIVMKREEWWRISSTESLNMNPQVKCPHGDRIETS